MKKLYFCNYVDENKSKNYYGNYWGYKKNEVVKLFCDDYNINYQELNRDNFIIYTIDNAIDKTELIEKIQRYLIKPLRK
jgi:hypothetical protein